MTLRVACPSGHPVILAADKLGTEVACPHCLTTFRAELEFDPRHHARKEDKARRARDDEDDEDDEDEDDEDEKPQKKAAKKSKDADEKPQTKAKPRKAKEEDDEEEEDEKPRKKKSAGKKEENDEEEDEDEDDEEEAEEEEPIVWNARKRQLKMCGIALIVMMVAYCIMMAFSFFLMLILDFGTFGIMGYIAEKQKIEGLPLGDVWLWAFGFIAAPFLGLVQLVILVGMVMSLLSVPAKVEGRGSLIGGIVFGGLVFLLAILIALSATGVISSDAVRAERMIQLMGGLAGLCFLLSTMSAMAYHGKLLHFMNLRMEASQPVTNTLFYYIYFAGAFAIFLAAPYVCYYLFNFFGWILLLAIDAVVALAIRQLIAQAQMFLLAKRAIDKYIREA